MKSWILLMFIFLDVVLLIVIIGEWVNYRKWHNRLYTKSRWTMEQCESAMYEAKIDLTVYGIAFLISSGITIILFNYWEIVI